MHIAHSLPVVPILHDKPTTCHLKSPSTRFLETIMNRFNNISRVFFDYRVTPFAYTKSAPNLRRVLLVWRNAIMSYRASFVLPPLCFIISRNTAIHNYRLSLQSQLIVQCIRMRMPWLICRCNITDINNCFQMSVFQLSIAALFHWDKRPLQS